MPKGPLVTNIVGCLLFQMIRLPYYLEEKIRINNINKRILVYEVISRDNWRDWWTYLQANSKLHELQIRWQGAGIKQFCHEYMQVCQVWLSKRESPSFQQ